MIIAVGCDEAGLELKNVLVKELHAAGVDVRDLSPNPALDYPDAAREVAGEVSEGRADQGILVCGTGIGMSITANKVLGVRAALCPDPYSARMSREHNDANVLCLGGRTIGPGAATEVLRAWLGGKPSAEERHVRRRDKVSSVERS
jgi:ribose 5-phosphate isomerase B